MEWPSHLTKLFPSMGLDAPAGWFDFGEVGVLADLTNFAWVLWVGGKETFIGCVCLMNNKGLSGQFVVDCPRFADRNEKNCLDVEWIQF